MNILADFFIQNFVVIYFFYGLAFFSMGLLVWLESGRNSEFHIARAMHALAGFGIIHGLHEWFEMFQLLGDRNVASLPGWLLLDEVRLVHLVLSFLLLIVFGVRLIYSSRNAAGDERLFAIVAAGALLAIWIGSSALTLQLYDPDRLSFLDAIDVLSRYILGIPGALLAAWAIILEQRTFRSRGMVNFGRSLLWAALAMILYGAIGQSFPRPSFLFPSNVVNSQLFMELFGFPVQLFRAAAAMIVAVFIIRALRAFEVERQQRLLAANEARLAAQRELLAAEQRAHEQTEQLNQALQTAVQDLTLLFHLARSLASSLDQKELFQTALDKIMASLPRVQAGLILWRDRHDDPLRLAAEGGFNHVKHLSDSADPAFLETQRLGVYVVRQATPALGSGSRFTPLTSRGRPMERPGEPAGDNPDRPGLTGQMVGTPLLLREEVLGSLVLKVKPGHPPFTVHDLSLISTVAGQIGLAIQNAALYAAAQAREARRAGLLQQIVAAQERERHRIARELHDGAGQILTGLGLGLAAAAGQVATEPQRAEQKLVELKQLSAQALQELRSVISDLRPSVLDDLGLVPALHGQVKAFGERAGVAARFTVNGRRRRVDPNIETVVFRIAQEALTNVAKHARASQVHVCLGFEPDRLQLTVADDGVGFDPDVALSDTPERRRAWGLLGMQERVGLVHGRCLIRSQPGQGTTVEVTIPLSELPEVIGDG